MNWKITQIKTLDTPVAGTVVNASFSVSDGTSTIESDTNLLPPDVDSFTQLDAATEEQVIQWVKDALDDGVHEEEYSNVKKYEDMVAQKTGATQSQITPFPWQ